MSIVLYKAANFEKSIVKPQASKFLDFVDINNFIDITSGCRTQKWKSNAGNLRILLAMSLGYATALLARLEMKVAKTLAIEVGIQNSATGIFIATTLLNNISLALPAMIYTGVAFVNVAVFILIFQRRFHYAQTA